MFLNAAVSLRYIVANKMNKVKTIVPSCSEKFSLGTPNFNAIWNTGTGGGRVHKTFWVIIRVFARQITLNAFEYDHSYKDFEKSAFLL